jgi:hypothetical protein
MLRFALLAALLLVVGGTPAQAQPADTTASGTTTVDTTADRPADPSGAAPDSVATGPGPAANRRAQATAAARTAAEEWLALIGAGAFEESWAAADPTLRARISREDWADQGLRAQYRLDTLRARRLTRAQYRASAAQLGGRPAVILRYAAEYAKGRAREAVITTKRDTAWAVAGYRVVSARGDSLRVRPDTTQGPSAP